jgi:hypothetical protein
MIQRSRSMVSRMAQRTGADFELVVVQRLIMHGCVEVEQVATPMRLVRGIPVRSAKVSCDIKAILPPFGRAVMVECKLRPGQSLQWSDLQEHQHRRLKNCLDAGGIALIAYSDTTSGIHLLDYYHLREICHWRPRVHLSADDIEVAGRAGLWRLKEGNVAK